MIALSDRLPEITSPAAEYLRIKCLFDSYKDDKDTYFWMQDGGKAVISLADGDMTIYRTGGDADELTEFIKMMSPRSIFTSLDTFEAVGIVPVKTVNVMCRLSDIQEETAGDSLSSRELYGILSAGGFDMPDYPFFAVDFCRRLNRGYADYFAVKGKCAAVSFHSGNYALINGIVSLEKGMGGAALTAILGKNTGRTVLACCEDNITGFYGKYGFYILYRAGYWWKTQT